MQLRVFPLNALCSVYKCQEGGRWRRFHHPQQPVCLCLFWWAMMKAQVDARNLPLPRQLCEFLICGFLLAREWRFAAWLLGTVGWSSQSPVCSLACRAPRVSLVPEGETNNKKSSTVSHAEADPHHIRLSTQWGCISLLGDREMANRDEFFLKVPPDNETAVVFALSILLSQFKWHRVVAGGVADLFFFSLCF